MNLLNESTSITFSNRAKTKEYSNLKGLKIKDWKRNSVIDFLMILKETLNYFISFPSTKTEGISIRIFLSRY